MDELAGYYDPAELNRIGFRLYEGFGPDVPAGAERWSLSYLLTVIERVRDGGQFTPRQSDRKQAERYAPVPSVKARSHRSPQDQLHRYDEGIAFWEPIMKFCAVLLCGL